MTNTIKRRHRFQQARLDPDDPGDPGENFTLNARASDDAFVAAMRKAARRGKERVTEGVKTADPTEIRSIPRPFVASRVFTASSISDC